MRPCSEAIAPLVEAIASAWQLPFRGEIYEYAGAAVNLQQGYAVKGAFDINTARHLIEPLQAIRNQRVRLVSIQAAVQTLKSLVADIVVPYWIEHDPGDILWLFEDDPKAKLYADSRAMPLIRSIPAIHAMLQGVERHEKTKTKIKFSHCNLVLAGLNEGNVQSISWRYVILDEAWMARANGLIRQAKDRTKQYPDSKKILILGQGGWEDEDADLEHKQTDMRELHYACPACSYSQPFDLSRLRDEHHPNPTLRGSYSGLSWDTNEITKPGGRWNLTEVHKTAHYRCFACDHRIEDTPAVRRRLNDSYHFVATNPGGLPGHVGFHWPAEASMRIPFGDVVVKYLKAKTQAEELAYRLPLQEFFQKDRAVTWSEAITDEHRPIVHEPYDIQSDWPEEAHRLLIVDCQRDLAKFFCTVYAVALTGEVRELARTAAASFDEVAAKQTEWKVKDQQVFLDCGYQMTKVLSECVRHGHVGTVRIGGKERKLWLCWNGLKGSGQEMWAHKNPRTGLSEYRIYSPRKFYDVNLGKAKSAKTPRAPWYEWSNLHCKDLLRARRDADPGLPKFLSLPDELPTTDPWSYFAQMRSEKREEIFSGGKKRAIWKLVKETRPNHRWDIGAMLMSVLAMLGIIGEPAAIDLAA
jgi:Phage terminase large subunit gpA, ATPase domain